MRQLYQILFFPYTRKSAANPPRRINHEIHEIHERWRRGAEAGERTRMTDKLVGDAGAIVRKKELPVLERLTKAIMALNVETKIGHEIMEQVHRPQNALMHQKMQATLLAGILPILTELIEEGNQQGVFHTRYPESVVEMTILYANTAFDELNVTELTRQQRERKIAGFIYNLERLMGMPEGGLQEAILTIFHGSRLGSDGNERMQPLVK